MSKPEDSGRAAAVLVQVKQAEQESKDNVVVHVGGAPGEVTLTSSKSRSLRQSTAIYHQRTKEEISDLARAHRFNKGHEPRIDDYHGRKCCGCKAKNCCFQVNTFFYLLRSFSHVLFTITTLWVLALSVAGTVLFTYFKVSADLPLSLVTIGVVFPISFLISFTISRRERVVLDVASLKASALGLYFIAREWPPPSKAAAISEAMRDCLEQLLDLIAKYLSHKNCDIYSIYATFDELQHLCEEIRLSDDWIRSVVSRAYQYVRYMMNDFERLRTVADFRTPSVFRAFTFIWLTLFPVMFSPYFAEINLKVNRTNPPYWQGIYSAIISALMLSVLYNICEELEDPFDDYGTDDLNMEMVKEPTFFMFHRTRADLEMIKEQKRKAKRASAKKPTYDTVGSDLSDDSEGGPAPRSRPIPRATQSEKNTPVVKRDKEDDALKRADKKTRHSSSPSSKRRGAEKDSSSSSEKDKKNELKPKEGKKDK